MKKIIAAALILVMLLSLSVSAYAATITKAGALSDQLDLIYDNFSSLRQDDSPTAWYYAVTDLDHDGRLELLALTSTNDLKNEARVKGWEISQDGKRIEPVKHEYSDAQNPDIKDGFPNIMVDSADTYYDDTAKLWYYVITDYSESSYDLTPEESAQVGGMKHTDIAITSVYGLSKHGDHFDRGMLGFKLVTTKDGVTEIDYNDKDGKVITEEQFLNLGATTFAGKQRSNTGFDWFTAAEAASRDRFVKSYSVFDNSANASEAPRPNTVTNALSLTITKNPTNETRNAGETAIFIANALNYTCCAWTFVDPSGNARTPAEFMRVCGGNVVGDNSTELRVNGLNTNMNGWGVYCTFAADKQSARTTTAYIYTRYSQDQLNNRNLSDFYTTWAWLYGTWICPFCGSEVWGDYCPYCGFDPDYYYYYGDGSVWVDPSLVLPYGGTGSFDDSFAWYCPLCGAGNNGSICWSCGYDPDRYIGGFNDSYAWYCPICGTGNNGSVCTGCGFDPDAYVSGSGTWDSGYSGSGSWADWYCPICGVGNVTDICWNCGYVHGSVVSSGWGEPVYGDIWYDGIGSGSWSDDVWDYGSSWDYSDYLW